MTIQELARNEHEPKFGDQAAFNLVLFEWPFRILNNSNNAAPLEQLSVKVLPPVQFPTGALFFDYHDHFYGGSNPQQLAERKAVIVHNNYLIGTAKKVERFKKHGLWFEDRYGRDKTDEVLNSSGEWKDLVVLGSRVAVEDFADNPGGAVHGGGGGGADDDYYFPYRNPIATVFQDGKAKRSNRCIVTVTHGSGNPYFDSLVLPRLRSYAQRVRSDLLVVRRGASDAVAADVAATWRDALRAYEAVAGVGNTFVMSSSAPDLFDGAEGKLFGTVGDGSAPDLVVISQAASSLLEAWADKLSRSGAESEGWVNAMVVAAAAAAGDGDGGMLGEVDDFGTRGAEFFAASMEL
jgi:hypothetical protein